MSAEHLVERNAGRDDLYYQNMGHRKFSVSDESGMKWKSRSLFYTLGLQVYSLAVNVVRRNIGLFR